MTYNTVIVGAGVSGMTAALYLKRAKIPCCIIENKAPGGQINYTSTIENYPGNPNILGPDLAFNIYNQLTKINVPFIFEEVRKITKENEYYEVCTNKQKITAKNIIIATGRSPKKLGAKNEEKLQAKGISYCAICDGPLYKDKEIVVIGGGDSAIKESIFLSNICKKVTIINRRDSFRSKEDTTILENKENIKIIMNNEVKEFVEDDDKLSKVILKNNEEIMCSGCFIFIGYEPKTKIFNNLHICDNEGYIKTDNECKTTMENIFAIGDVRQKGIFQIITGMNDGVIVAKQIIDKS